MGIAGLTEKWSQRDSSFDVSSRRSRRTFEVVLDDPLTPDTEILAAAKDGVAIPKYAEKYPGDFWKVVRSVRITARRGPMLVDVEAEYESVGVSGDPSSIEDPIGQKADVEWDFVDVEFPATLDADDKPITTVVGEPYKDVTITDSDLLLRISMNESSYNATLAATFKNAINADNFIGFAPGTVKCNKITGRRVWNGTSFYWRTTYEFQIRLIGWQIPMLHAGTRKFVKDANGKVQVVAIKYTSGDSVGQPISEPVLLSEDGFDDQLNNPALVANYRKFWMGKRVNFAPLNLSGV